MTPPVPDRTLHAPSGEDADAREFESFARDQNPLDIDAATWASRRRDGLSAAGEAELQAWLNADPRHSAALADMEGTVGDVRLMPADDVAALKSGLPARASRLVPPGDAGADRPRRSWWPGLGQWVPQAALALLVVLTVVGGGWLGWDRWQRQPTFEQAFGTGRGQQLTVRLPDDAASGSTLQLDTATRLEATLYRDRREVRLTDGQAMFAVHPDARRPFHVLAGNLRITVVGTKFSVRHTSSGLDAGQTVVSVEEGRVRVVRTYLEGTPAAASLSAPDKPDTPDTSVDLHAGSMLAGDSQGRLGPVTVVSPSAIAQWRHGRISFDHTPLQQALAEFERYGRTGLLVRDPAVARMPVGGSYDLRQFQQFVRTLPEVLPVRLVQQGDVTEVVAR